MKIPNRRKGLSQSTDLLLILTATLSVGGIMYAVATGLIGGMGNVTSLQVVSTGIHVGTSSSTFTISLKNSGNTVIKGTATVALAGVTLPATVTTTGGDTGADTFTWSCATTGICTTSASVTLKAGDVLSLSFNAASGFTAGNTYPMNGGIGSTTFAASTVASSA